MASDPEAPFERALASGDWSFAANLATKLAADPTVGFRDRWVGSVRVLTSLAGGEHLAAAAWHDAIVLADPRVSRALLQELRRVGEVHLATDVAWHLSILEDDGDAALDDGGDDFITKNATRFADFWLAWLGRWPLDPTANVQALSHLMLADRHAEALSLAEAVLARPPVDEAVAAAAVRALMAGGAVDRARDVASQVGSVVALMSVADGLTESDPAEAAAWFERALALDPNDTSVLYAFASLLHDQGDTTRARQLEARIEAIEAAEADDESDDE